MEFLFLLYNTMGVTGLWSLLAPVGKPVTLESLAGLRLAIDTSIWLQQFQLGMEDRGESMENAYLKAFFMRISKLLFFNIRPVFVFDGETPSIKKKTTAARRKLRKRQEADVRKRAESLLRSLHPDVITPTKHDRKDMKEQASNLELDEVQWLPASEQHFQIDAEEKDATTSISSSSDTLAGIDLTVFAELPEELKQEILMQSIGYKNASRRHEKLSPTQFSQRQVLAAIENGKRTIFGSASQAVGNSEVGSFASEPGRAFALLKDDTGGIVQDDNSYHCEGGGFLVSDDEEGEKRNEKEKEKEKEQENEKEERNDYDEESVLEISIDPADIDPSTCLFDETFFAPPSGFQDSAIHPPTQPVETFDASLDTLDCDTSQVLSEADQILASEAAALSQAARSTSHPVQGRSTELQHACIILLKLFGIPWVQSPMEAEAQCAELQRQGLVDAVATEDSDAFLVGAETVYRYLFNREQHVTLYRLRDIHQHLGLDRDKLINLALLLGSDYTSGIKGVGPVTAMEILSEFHDLLAFKAWWSSPEEPTKSRMNWLKDKLAIPDDFPQQEVLQAYYSPTVDASAESFTWAAPDPEGLRKFAREHFGWTQEKSDETLLPLLKRQQEEAENPKPEAKKQTTLETFNFVPKEPPLLPQSIKSMRIRNAILEMQNKSKKRNNNSKKSKAKEPANKRTKTK